MPYCTYKNLYFVLIVKYLPRHLTRNRLRNQNGKTRRKSQRKREEEEEERENRIFPQSSLYYLSTLLYGTPEPPRIWNGGKIWQWDATLVVILDRNFPPRRRPFES